MSKKCAHIRRGDTVVSKEDIALHEADISQRSITPTTHKYRDLFKDITDLQQTLSSSPVVPTDISDAVFYCDIYDHHTWKEKVLHFGINGNNARMKVELTSHNATQRQNMTNSGSVISNASNATEYPAVLNLKIS